MKLLHLMPELILLEVANNIHWDFKDDERSKTLESLIKYNNGVWKSAKQRAFLTGPKGPMGGDAKANGHQRRDHDFLKSNFGVTADKSKNEYVIDVGGTVVWSPLGGKSVKPFGKMYVMDDFGVVKKYKLGWKGEMRTGTSIDIKKTKLEWERPSKIDTSHLDDGEKEIAAKKAEIADKNAKSQYVGEIGKFIDDVIVTIEKIVDLGPGEFGERYMTILKDKEDNVFNYFGWPKTKGEWDTDLEGKTFSMRAKIKKHYVNKNGVKVTVLGYPKFIKKG